MITTDSNALHSHQPGLCILMATVLPPHMAASAFPIAASRTGPRRIRALYLFVAEKKKELMKLGCCKEKHTIR
jgi:hypothetical protein